MQWLAAISVKRPVFASVLILSLTVVGAFAFTQLGVDRFPKVDFPTVVVMTRLPGAAPEEVETEITDKIEEAVNTISAIDELRSNSSEGVSQVIISFLLEKDADIAAQEVRDRVNRVLPLLPKTIQQPTVEKFDPDAAPVLTLAVSAKKPVRDITEYADKTLRRQLESVNGVGQVVVSGGRARQINITLDAARLRAYNLTVTDVSSALQSQNAEIPGGRVEQGATALTLRTRGRVESPQQFGDIVVRQRDAHAILLRDVATIDDGMAEATTKASLNGEPTVLLTVRRQSGTNTVQVVDAVKERLADIAPLVPAGYNIRVVRDLSEFIKASIRSVEEHLIVGSILAAAVVLIFLWNWRSTIIAAVAIPTSIIATFGLIWYEGFTLNSMTLLALTLSVGIVIDDAIVVLENIYRFVEEKGMPPLAGRDRSDARNRARGAGDHAVAHRDIRPGRLHGRHRRPVHDQFRLYDVVRHPGVAARQLYVDADAGCAMDQDAPAPRNGGRTRGRGSQLEGLAVFQTARSRIRGHPEVVAGASVGLLRRSPGWCC